jgi:hypothetical protein
MVMSVMRTPVEECSVVVDLIRKSAATDKSPGEMVFLVECAMNLAF